MRDLQPPGSPQCDETTPSWLVWLWGPEQQLAEAEVAALAASVGGTAVTLGRRLVGSSVEPWRVLTRLGFGRAILRCLGWSPDAVPPFPPDSVIRGSFAVRHHSLQPATAANALANSTEEIAAQLWRRLRQPQVDLAHPDTDIHVFSTPTGLWWGKLLYEFDGHAFEARRPRSRPFWRSVALSPRKARCMVNLSGIQPGGRLLDPFCGTGSVPIEAALLGMRAHGSDLDPAVVGGAARNIAHLGAEVALSHRDARSWGASDLSFDAIVSDLPHGRTASLMGIPREDLYQSALEVIASRLVSGGRAVLMIEAGTLPAPPPSLALTARFYEVVHDDLTREVVILEKAGEP